jgi:hypothetical protein
MTFTALCPLHLTRCHLERKPVGPALEGTGGAALPVFCYLTVPYLIPIMKDSTAGARARH